MATLIMENGEQLLVLPKDKKKGFSLEEMYGALDCDMVEMRHIENTGQIVLMDEEGKGRNRDINPTATALLFPRGGDVVVGPVLVCDHGELQ